MPETSHKGFSCMHNYNASSECNLYMCTHDKETLLSSLVQEGGGGGGGGGAQGTHSQFLHLGSQGDTPLVLHWKTNPTQNYLPVPMLRILDSAYIEQLYTPPMHCTHFTMTNMTQKWYMLCRCSPFMFMQGLAEFWQIK